MSKPQHWAVSVQVDGVNILTIESNFLSGVEDIGPHEETIEIAALSLLSFIGKYGSVYASDKREAAFDRWWKISIHSGFLPSHRESLARDAFYAAWGGFIRSPDVEVETVGKVK